MNADADAGGDVKIMAIDGVGLGNRVQHSSRGNRGVFRLRNLREQHNEFIPAQPAYRIRAAKALLQSPGDGLKKLVPNWMPQRIVHVLEPVQIQK